MPPRQKADEPDVPASTETRAGEADGDPSTSGAEGAVTSAAAADPVAADVEPTADEDPIISNPLVPAARFEHGTAPFLP